MAKEIEKVIHDMPIHIKAQAFKASMYYKYFEQLKKEGFTEEQALEIVKARGLD